MKLQIDRNKLMVTKIKIQYLYNDLYMGDGGPLHVYIDEPNLIDDFDEVISELKKDDYNWSDCGDKEIDVEIIKTCIDIVNDFKNMTRLEYFIISQLEYDSGKMMMNIIQCYLIRIIYMGWKNYMERNIWMSYYNLYYAKIETKK